jgi:hypothetical protein
MWRRVVWYIRMYLPSFRRNQHLRDINVVSEEGFSRFFQNAGKYLPDYPTSPPALGPGREADHSPQFNVKVDNICGAIPPPPHKSSLSWFLNTGTTWPLLKLPYSHKWGSNYWSMKTINRSGDDLFTIEWKYRFCALSLSYFRVFTYYAACHEDVLGRGGTAPPFVTSALDSGASFLPRPLFLRGKSPRYPMVRTLSRPQSRSGHC